MIGRPGKTAKKDVYVMLGLVMVSIFNVHYLLRRFESKKSDAKFKFTILKLTEGSLQPDNRRIFFHETSGRGYLNVRQTCAIESAARNNPDRSVQLYLDRLNYSSQFLSVLKEYQNVIVVLFNESQYFANTPMEQWYLGNSFVFLV